MITGGVDTATLSLRVEGRQAEEGAKRAGKAIRDVGTESKKTAKEMRDGAGATGLMGSALVKLAAATAAAVTIHRLARAMAEATRYALEFNKAMAEVSTLLPDTEDLAAVSKEVRRLSVEFNQAPVEQARAMYQVISAGARNAAEASRILEVANRLAVGGVTSVTVAADGLTSLLNAYGLAASEATNVSDALFVAMKAGKTTIGELSGELGKVAPLAAQAGVGIDELAAATAALTKGGMQTNEVVTGLRAIMAAVVSPTTEAARTAKSLGLEFNSAALQAKGFATFMEDVVKATGGNVDTMALLFNNVRALVPALALSGQAGSDLAAIMEDMANKGGAAGAAFEKIASSDAYRLEKAMRELKDASIDLGNTILTVLVPAMELLAKAMRLVNRESDAMKRARALTDFWRDYAAGINEAERATTELAAAEANAALIWQNMSRLRDEGDRARSMREWESQIALVKALKERLEELNAVTAKEPFGDIGTGAADAADEVRTLTRALEEMAKVVKDQAFQRGVERVFNLRTDAGRLVGGGGFPTMGTEQVTMRLELPEREIAEFNRSLGDLGRHLVNNADAYVGVTRGVVSLTDSLGLLSDTARRAVRGVVDMAEGLRSLQAAQGMTGLAATATQFGGAMSILGGVTQLLASLFAKTEDASVERRRQQIIEDQRKATDEFRRAVDKFAVAVGAGPLRVAEAAVPTETLEFWARGLAAALGIPLEDAMRQYLTGVIAQARRFWEEFGDGFESWARDAANLNEYVQRTGGIPVEQFLEIIAAIQKMTEAYREELEVRRLLALGMTDEAATLRKQIDQRKELQAAMDAGWDEATIALLKEVLALEWDAFVESLKDAAEAVEDLDTAFLRNLDVRELYARGLDREAIALQRDIEYQELLARGFDEATVARLRYIHGLEDEAAALAAAEAARKQRSAFEGDLRIREATLGGSDLEALTVRLRIQAAEEMARARELLAAGTITEDMFRRLAAVISGETVKAIQDFADASDKAAEASRKAAAAEAHRAQQDMANLQVRLLQAQGLSEEAAVMRAHIELMQAVHEGRSAEYIALLEQIHAEEARARAMARSTAAINETAQAANEMARVLNAPTGLRLSLLQWRAQGPSLGSGVFPSPSADTGRPAQQTTSFTFGKESITIVAAKGESGEELLDRILTAANRRARAGAGNVFEDLSEAL